MYIYLAFFMFWRSLKLSFAVRFWYSSSIYIYNTLISLLYIKSTITYICIYDKTEVSWYGKDLLENSHELESHRKFDDFCLINDLLPTHTNIYIYLFGMFYLLTVITNDRENGHHLTVIFCLRTSVFISVNR